MLQILVKNRFLSSGKARREGVALDVEPHQESGLSRNNHHGQPSTGGMVFGFYYSSGVRSE
jgi:hypothetical protein